jgi:hypothetical protein
MTLIVAALTKKKGFLFGDQTRTILPQEGKQVQIKMDKIKIITDGTIYLQKSGTKIQPICNNSAYVAIAGDERKSQAFVNSLEKLKTVEEFNSFVNQYWLEHGDDSPDQFLILSKTIEKVYAESYFKYAEPRFNSYGHYTYLPKDEKLLFIALGSGAQPFLGYIHILNDDLEKQYNEATNDGTLLKWENDFVEKIKSIYTDIHHQIGSVGNDVDIITVNL